ncbi:MAG TPA: hypothetical protein VGO34_11540 [Alphaproteobacteria bacterium]|jgi:hypothetical protein
MSVSAAGILSMGSFAAPKPGAASGASPLGAKSAKEEFLDYARMTPAQRMEANILSQMGLTKEQLEAMPPAQRKAIEATIREQIKRQMEATGDKSNGKIADVTA